MMCAKLLQQGGKMLWWFVWGQLILSDNYLFILVRQKLFNESLTQTLLCLAYPSLHPTFAARCLQFCCKSFSTVNVEGEYQYELYQVLVTDKN